MKSNHKVENRCSSRCEALYFCECHKALRRFRRSSDLSQPRKVLYRVSGGLCFRSAWKAFWSVVGGDLLLMELDGRFLINSEFPLTWKLSLSDWAFKECLPAAAELCRKWPGTPTTESRFWDYVGEVTARIDCKQLVPLDVGYVVDNHGPQWRGKKRKVSLAILAMARIVIWMTLQKGWYDTANFSDRDLILFLRHQLRVKIRCDRRSLDCIAFNERWVKAASRFIRNGAMQESLFPSRPAS